MTATFNSRSFPIRVHSHFPPTYVFRVVLNAGVPRI